MDNVLIITILTIFAVAVIATVIQYRKRDKCLIDFRDFFVTLQLQDGKRIWGKLLVFHNGLELIYPDAHPDPDGTHDETSYMFYQDQFSTMFAIKRLHDELTPEFQQKRQEEIERTYHPNFGRRLARRIRNIFNLLRDAVGQALSLLIGQMKKTSQSTFVQSQEKRINDTARMLIGSGSAYEPIWERYIGRKVVLEIMENGQVEEYCGILKDYTNAFITLLDVELSDESEFMLSNARRLDINRVLDFELNVTPSTDPGVIDLAVHIHNRGSLAVEIMKAQGAGYTHDVSRVIPPGASYDVLLPQIPTSPTENADKSATSSLPDVALQIQSTRMADLVVPRAIATIRHGAEYTRKAPLIPV